MKHNLILGLIKPPSASSFTLKRINPGLLNSEEDLPDGTVLVGAFSNMTGEKDWVVSPTLKLNADLCDLSHDSLLDLAMAEQKRLAEEVVKSHLLESRAEAVVISDSPEKMRRFLDDLAGVIDIKPILTRGYGHEWPVAEELELSEGSKGLNLSVAYRLPVEQGLCSYCGACGPACPQGCLDEDLNLDFSRCDRCGECTRVCPEGAIDIHRMERVELLTPAVVILGNPEIALPRNSRRIYREDALRNFFSTIGVHRIDEAILHVQRICQYHPRLDVGCSQCLDACPHDAISRTETGLLIDHERCAECGACVAVCPTGAMQYGRFSDRSFLDYFSHFRPVSGTTLVIGTESSLKKIWWRENQRRFPDCLFLVHPQPLALNAMHLLFLFAIGVSRIIVVGRRHSSDQPFWEQIRFVNTILGWLVGMEPCSVHEPENLSKDTFKPVAHPLKVLYKDFGLGDRREKTASILRFLLDFSPQKKTLLQREVPATYGWVLCDTEACTGCVACLNVCSLEALKADPEDFSVVFTPVRCIQCGACVTVCPGDALTLKHGLGLGHDFFGPQTLFTDEPMVCKECGKVFGSKKSFEHVIKLLETGRVMEFDTSVLQYCETCRAIKIFESMDR